MCLTVWGDTFSYKHFSDRLLIRWRFGRGQSNHRLRELHGLLGFAHKEIARITP